MNNTNKTLIALMALVLALSFAAIMDESTFSEGNGVSANADFEYEGLNYKINSGGDGTVTLLGPAEGGQESGELKLSDKVYDSNEKEYIVTTIGDNAFNGRTTFTGSLAIPNTVTSIGLSAFNSCMGFTGTLTIPNTVTSISLFAFNDCSGFTGPLTIEGGSIGSYAFNGCSGFTDTLTIKGGDIGNSAFVGCKFTALVLEEGVTSIGINTFSGCADFEGPLTIPSTVTSIGLSAFNGCSGFTDTLTIKGGDIGNSAFVGCKFTALVLEEGVTSIGSNTFSGCADFEGTLTIPSTVTTIGDNAFKGCTGFTDTLTIPSTVTTIGNSAFVGCKFTALVLEEGVTSIGGGAFNGCADFEGTLTIPSTVTTIGGDAFNGCTGFTDTLTIKGGSIGNYAFKSCKFTALVLEEGVTSIGNNAFNGCTDFEGTLTIPSTVTTIGNYAFNGCTGFTDTLTIKGGDIGNYAFNGCTGFTDTLTIEKGSIGGNAFVGCKFTTLVLKEGVTSIGGNAFKGCTGFKGPLTIPSTVTTIGDFAFYGCADFEGPLTIPSTVTSIGYYAFSGCTGFTGTLTIKGGSISGSAFVGCKFTTLVLEEGVTSIGSGAFSGCTDFEGPLTIPSTVTTISDNAFSGCTGFTGTLTIKGKSIGSYAFAGCKFTTLVLEEGVISIGSYAFSDCTDFEGPLTIPSTVTTISDNAFSGCTGFTDTLTIKGGSIDSSAFAGCKFTTLVLEEGVTSIGNSAFSGCTDFEGSLIIPSTVTAIGANAFNGCTGFTGSLIIPSTVTSIGYYAFSGCTGFEDTLTIKGGSISDSAFVDCRFTELVLEEGVTSIGNYAFNGCTGFTGSLTIPSTVTAIGNYAFNGCTGFTGSLTILSTVTSIGNYAFNGCTGFEDTLTIKGGSIGHNAFVGCKFAKLILEEGVNSIDYDAFENFTETTWLIVDSGVTGINANAFRGWKFVDSDGKEIEDISNIVGHTFIGMTTKMKQVDCHVTFVFDEEEFKVIEVIVGTNIEQLKDPVKEGFVFKEWQINGNPVSWPYTVTENVTINAVWIQAYEIKFTDGESQILDSLYFIKGEKFPLPFYEEEGFRFLGWKINGDTTIYPAGTTITVEEKGITFVAVLSEIRTIEFKDGGSSILDPLSLIDGEKFKLPALTNKEGYIFAGWYYNGVVYPAENEMEVNGNAIYEARWTAVLPDYVLSFDVKGGSIVVPAKVVQSGSKFTFGAYEGTLLGYVFVGWSDGQNVYVEGDEVTVEGSVTFTAVWDPITYYVKFDSNGGFGTMAQMTVNYGATVNLTQCSFTKENFTFLGWSIDGSKVVKYLDNESVLNLSSAKGATVTLYAVWSPGIIEAPETVEKGSQFDVELFAGNVQAISLISLDGTESFVTEDMYIVGNGTSITFKSEFSSDLTNGKYQLYIVTDEGNAYVPFSITGSEPPQPSNGGINILFVLGIAVAMMIVWCIASRKE